MQMKLLRRSSTSRGSSDIRTVTLKNTGTVQQVNRLYILTVRRQSLLSKINTLTHQLHEAKEIMKGIEADIRGTESQYRKLSGRRPHKKAEQKELRESGSRVKKMSLAY
ncbi:MAG: hypothetical protein HYS08_01640 [Chlamydiae bacterium]|nr:hypothetical protein [Chlamydiota bacterium]MBI3266496.1 hypothetical protein [Chlamydiota bacterium]